ncbi:hypothetical protein [Aliarcobacter skirrowii]|uniref:hypothetical protein n=1 Tax=Aliarcobacter skirrowii TaxID=28200 RepID=UPI0029ACEFF9|nr:hypothetical protein [Aliarcobacter skirrowii]MDX4028354.1 hypothetical protein [Aliarcobacter skirrowii]
MTKKIDGNKDSFAKLLDLTNLTNLAKISSFEKKSITILSIVRNELSRLYEDDHDETSLAVLKYLESRVPDYKEIEDIFEDYHNEKNFYKKIAKLKNLLPIEEVGVYLNESAIIYNKFQKLSELAIKAFSYNLIHDWFVGEKANSVYIAALKEFDFQKEIDKLIERTKNNKESREDIKKAFENSIEISEFLNKFAFTVIIPKSKIMNISKRKKQKR